MSFSEISNNFTEHSVESLSTISGIKSISSESKMHLILCLTRTFGEFCDINATWELGSNWNEALISVWCWCSHFKSSMWSGGKKTQKGPFLSFFFPYTQQEFKNNLIIIRSFSISFRASLWMFADSKDLQIISWQPWNADIDLSTASLLRVLEENQR